ncbi:MAG: 7TM-DISM domain-containing protein [bacterium]|nr:7TM-DISM domain-containing protein [bacterium]
MKSGFSETHRRIRPPRRPRALFAAAVLALAFISFGTGFAPLFAQNSANVWRYTFLDDPYNALIEQDDSFWKTVELPANMTRFGARAGQPVWLRTRVLLNASREKNYALYLGAIYDEDRVYFNGEQIGRNGAIAGGAGGREEINGYGRPRIYPIPDQLIQDGENLVAIRITGQFSNSIGILRGPVRIQSLRDSEWHMWRHHLRGLVMSAIYAVIGVFFLILNQRLPGQREYRWFGLFAVAFGLQQFLVNENRFVVADWFLPFKLLEQLCYLAIPTLYFWFHVNFFRIETLHLGGQRNFSLKKIGVFYTALNVATGLVLIVTMSPVLWDRIISAWFLVNLPFFLYFVIFTFGRAIATGERDAIILSIGTALMLLITVHYNGVERGFFDGPHYFRIGVLLFILALAFALIYRLIELQLEVEKRSRRLDTVNVLRDRVFNYLNTFVRKPTESISEVADELLQTGTGTGSNPAAAATARIHLTKTLNEEIDQLQSNLDDILELARLEVITQPEYVEQVNFHDFITAVIPQGVITHHIKVNPNIVLNTSLELVNSLVIRLIDFPAFREFKHIDLIITSDLKAHVHFRFLMFHDNVRKTRQLYELLTGLNPERGHLWVKWAIVREIIRILDGHLDINILNRKFLRIDIELAGEFTQELQSGRRRRGEEAITVEHLLESVGNEILEDAPNAAPGKASPGVEPWSAENKGAAVPAVAARPVPKLHANMSVGELKDYLKARLGRKS